MNSNRKANNHKIKKTQIIFNTVKKIVSNIKIKINKMDKINAQIKINYSKSQKIENINI